MGLSRIWPASSKLDALIVAAREGSQDALGHLLEECREYVLLVADRELGQDLRAKIGPSDLVQETFVHAQQGFGGFKGSSERELLAWLRGILFNQVFRARRHFSGTIKRDMSREMSSDSDSAIRQLIMSLPANGHSPDDELASRDDSETLYKALEQLPAHYRQVLVLRYWQGMPFADIGERMGRSAAAVHKLWARALEQLDQLGHW
jgi:RNA polymerase sigma-70 factor, ECF subfamily